MLTEDDCRAGDRRQRRLQTSTYGSNVEMSHGTQRSHAATVRPTWRVARVLRDPDAAAEAQDESGEPPGRRCL